MLILSPTRELAIQIAAVMEESGASSGLKTLCAYGGVPKPPQVWDEAWPCLGLFHSGFSMCQYLVRLLNTRWDCSMFLAPSEPKQAVVYKHFSKFTFTVLYNSI